MEELIEAYRSAQQEVNKLLSQIRSTSDGYRYVSRLRCYGSISHEDHNSSFTVQELCDEYTGENGIVDVYTTNPNHCIDTYGDVMVVTEEELLSLAKENISMSRAICNWMVGK